MPLLREDATSPGFQEQKDSASVLLGVTLWEQDWKKKTWISAGRFILFIQYLGRYLCILLK